MGHQRTLNDIEHEILRVDYAYPAIHMSLVCAAMGCPPLRREPYVGEDLDNQHADQVLALLRHPEKFRIDHEARIVHLSSIFEWFGEDFLPVYGTNTAFPWGNDVEQAVMTFLAPHLPESDRTRLREQPYDVSYLTYDWSLNEQ